MAHRTCPRGKEVAGYTLLAVMVFVLVLTIAGAMFFAMASYETKGALYRQRSSEAFYLADGAVERARARLLDDRSWRAGWTDVAAGRGTYDLTIRDSVFTGYDDVVRLLATGAIDSVRRKIEVFASVPPSAFGLPLLVMGDANVNGNLCLEGGTAHVNGGDDLVGADFGPHDSHLACGSYTSGFRITPPPIYTHPDSFPGATYYYVRGHHLAGNDYNGHIFDADGNDITHSPAINDSLADVTSYNSGQREFTFEFDSAAEIDFYFNDLTGVFRPRNGAMVAVVNFGELPMAPLPAGVANVTIDADADQIIHATIIDTRFTGVTLDDRYDTRFWTGGLMFVKQIIWEPYYGIAFVSHDFQYQGGSLVQLGTPNFPALVYATGDVVELNSNFNLLGSVICLGDWTSQGSPHIVYDEGFIENLPPYLQEDWPAGSSGTMQVLLWREVSEDVN